CPRPPLLLSPASQATSSYYSFDLYINKRLIGEGKEWEKGEKETGSAVYARTGTMPLDPSVTDVSSLVFSLTPKLLLIPNGFLVLVIGSALMKYSDMCFAKLRLGNQYQLACTNNNYASREKCKKCGQPKEIAAMPAIAMPGASLPTYSHYFARALGALEQKMNVGFVGSGAPQQFLPLSSNWSVGGADNCGLQSAPTWPVAGNQSPGAYANPGNQPLSVPKGWRNGDWICNCGFHNYSSRS
ncbi:hypothetical protein Gorai_005686, partial [Gossypium raimondii]|nr:hypothetical protein [Gossypium raimondii]